MTEMAPYRILMLLENCPYPQDDRVRREARSLAAAGYSVTVICPSMQGQPRREVIDGVSVIRYPPPPDAQGALGYLWEWGYSLLASLFLSLGVALGDGFDVIHTHHPPDVYALIGGFYKLFGKKYVLDHHDLAPELYHARFGGPGNPWVYRALRWWESLACRLANFVIATNQSYKKVDVERNHVPASRIAVVRNGPDLNEFTPGDAALDLPGDGRFILAYVGVMGFQDGVDYFLRALQHLVDDLDRKNVYCLMMGSGDALSSLQEQVKTLHLEPYVRFTGFIDGPQIIASNLSAAHICIAPEPSNPYNDRSTAAKVMEYMAIGKPVVAFDLPEHRHSAGEAALYARPNDEMDYARKIMQLMDDPALRQRMGQAGIRRIREELSWQQQEKALLAAYQALREQP